MFYKENCILLIVFLVFITPAMACTAGYCYRMKHTPEYALEQATKAIRDRDKDLLERYVDIDAVVSHGYDEGAAVLAKNIKDLNAQYPHDPFFWHDTIFMQHYISEHRLKSLAFIHDIIDRYLARSTVIMNFEQDPTGSLTHELEVFQTETEPEIISIENHGDKAWISIVLHGSNTPYGRLVNNMPFVFEFVRQNNGTWKIIRIANPEQLLWPVTDAAEAYWTMQGWQN